MDRREEPKLDIASIDGQHHTLMDMLNAFQTAILSQRPKDDVRAAADLGLASIRALFALEEELGERTGFPEAAEHQFKHRHLMLNATTLTRDALSGPPEIRNENIALLRQMFLNHIAEEDRALAGHLKRHGVG